MKQERADIIHLINDARASGAGQSKACEVIGISSKTYQRWIQPENESDGRLYAVNEPVDKLSDIDVLIAYIVMVNP